MIHHKSWFPVVVIALTALLGLFIYSTFKDRLGSQGPSPVSAAEYQAAVKQSLSGFPADLDTASDDAERITRLTTAREALLSLVVPAEDKDLHLEMVMILTSWIAGYQGDAAKVESAAARWQMLVEQYPWL